MSPRRLTFWSILTVAALAVLPILQNQRGSSFVTYAKQQDEEKAELKAACNESVDKAVGFLMRVRSKDGMWPPSEALSSARDRESVMQFYGSSALVALALHESGDKSSDVRSAITKAASAVKGRVLQRDFTYTYSLCLAIMLLDRVYGKNAKSDILALSSKVMSGQTILGKWTYHCPPGGHGNAAIGDNSNTQFAVVALWIAKRHGAKVDKALSAAEKMFRGSFQGTGWGYDLAALNGAPPSGEKVSSSMTCAGLLGIALTAKEKKERQASFKNDKVDELAFRQEMDRDPMVVASRAALVKYITGDLRDITHFSYFVWSLERVCLLYGWKTKIDQLDWFGLLARVVMKAQRPTGNWDVDNISGTNCDTSFMILFLKQSNLLADPDWANFAGGVAPGASNLKAVPQNEKKADTTPKDDPRKLAQEYLTLAGTQRTAVLDKLEAGKGGEFTDALAWLIPQLATNEQKDVIRDALSRRLQRSSAKTLSAYILGSDQDMEVRLAAIQAVGSKDSEGKKALIPDIIAFMDLGDSRGKSVAYDTLKSITKQDMGPRSKSWNDWWTLKGKEFNPGE